MIVRKVMTQSTLPQTQYCELINFIWAYLVFIWTSFVSSLTKSVLLTSHFFPLLTVRESVWSATDEQHKEHFSLTHCHLPEPWFIPLAFMGFKTPNMAWTLLGLSVSSSLSFSSVEMSAKMALPDHIQSSGFCHSGDPLFGFLHIIHDYVTTVDIQLLVISSPTEM